VSDDESGTYTSGTERIETDGGTRSAFGYPGGKYYHADWIISRLPVHRCYVEPFGGSGVVLLSKPESDVEVYNDRDGDVVHFFEVLRDRPDELQEWLARVPFSRDLHDEWSRDYYQGLRPSDDVERAGRWFYLRFSQYGGKYTGVSGFSAAQKRDPASKFHNRVDRLDEFADRLRSVQVENLDYAEVFDRYDAPDTVFYCDPPYLDEGDALYTHEGKFDHERFLDALTDLEADWLVSYTRLPEELQDGYHVVEKDMAVRIRQGQGDWEKENTERLVMNFNPQETPLFRSASQRTLREVGADTNQSGGDDDAE